MKQTNTPELSPWYDHARVAVTALEAAGIPAAIADIHMHHAYPSLEFGAFRTRILIPPSCYAEALEIMEQARASRYPPLYPCPVCAGETRQRIYILPMVALALLGCFFPLRSPKRRCGACHVNLDAPVVEPFTEEELGEAPVLGGLPDANWLSILLTWARTLLARRRYWDAD
jgi:hypothetical protein